jgi:hypothetical protein
LLKRQAVQRSTRTAVLTTKEIGRARNREDLKKSEAWLRQKAASLRAEARSLEQDAAEFEKLADAMKARADQGLPPDIKTRSLIGMNSTHAAEGSPRWRGRPPKTKHPFPAALRKKKKSNVKRWSEEHGIPYTTVKSWFADADTDAGRAIPRRYAELIEQELGLPANRSVCTTASPTSRAVAPERTKKVAVCLLH